MKNTLLLIALVCMSAICAAAQKPEPKMTMSAEPSLDSGLWKEYSYKEDNVRFRLPAEPELTTDKAKNERRYTSGPFELTVSPAGVDVGKDREVQKRYMILLSLSIDETMKTSVGKTVKREDTIDGMPALYIELESSDGTISRAKMFAVGEKVYTAQVDIPKSDRSGPQQKEIEKAATAFLDSIHLISK